MKQSVFNIASNTPMKNIKKSILVLEDDESWQAIYNIMFSRWGWPFQLCTNPGQAIQMLQQEDRWFDVVLADKGGTNGMYGTESSPDLYGHRDGLQVLRASFELYPDSQLRVLSTGEYWSKTVFDDSSLGLHAFVEKGGGAERFFEWIQRVKGPEEVSETKVFRFQPNKHKERDW